MAKFCPVVPPRMLPLMQESQSDGDHHLLLAHDIKQKAAEYQAYFPSPQLTDPGKGLRRKFVFMDNSVVELGDAQLLPTMMDAIQIVKSDVIVLPDVLRDGPKTVQAVKDHYETWFRSIIDSDIVGLRSFMVVPQGRDFNEWLRCCEALSDDMEAVGWWGIPRNITEMPDDPSRMKAVELANAMNPRRKIHLLGFSDVDMYDDVISARHPKVYSIDSAVPIRAASLGQRFALDLVLPKRGTWWEDGEYNPELTAYNVEKYRRLVTTYEQRRN